MTTRAERLANAERLARTQLERQRTRLAKVQAQQREEERRALTKRRQLVGTMVDEAGLFALDDVTLAVLFSLVATLLDAPDPVAVLEGLLRDGRGTPGRVVPGCAHRADGVAPAVPL